MALVALGQLGLDEILAAAGGDLAPEFLAQLVVKRPVAPQIARFQKRGADGDVLFGQPHAFGQRARGMADLQPQVPQHVEDEFDDAFAPGGLLEGAHEQQIDVRSRRQLAAAIAAGRHDRDAFGGGGILRVIDMLDGEVIDHLDDGVLQRRQRPGRRQSCRPCRSSTAAALTRARPARNAALIRDRPVLAQGAAIAAVLGQRGQRTAQRVGIDQRRRPARWRFGASTIPLRQSPDISCGEPVKAGGFVTRGRRAVGRGSGPHRPHHHAAGDARAGFAHRLAAVIVAARIQDDRHAVAVEDRTLAVADAKKLVRMLEMQMCRRRWRTGWADRLPAAVVGQEAVLLAGRQRQDRAGAGEAGFGVAIARDMQVHAVRARAGRPARSNSISTPRFTARNQLCRPACRPAP